MKVKACSGNCNQGRCSCVCNTEYDTSKNSIVIWALLVSIAVTITVLLLG